MVTQTRNENSGLGCKMASLIVAEMLSAVRTSGRPFVGTAAARCLEILPVR